MMERGHDSRLDRGLRDARGSPRRQRGYHSNLRLARNVLGPMLSRSLRPTIAEITPGADVIFVLGLAQFG